MIIYSILSNLSHTTHLLTVQLLYLVFIPYIYHIAMSDNGDSPIDVDHSDGEDVKPKRADTGAPRKRVCHSSRQRLRVLMNRQDPTMGRLI